MSFYNMLFGRNPQTALLLAVIGLRENDVERFRDVYVSEDGHAIEVYTRTGGGNRDDYPNLTMRKLPGWQGSVDDDYDTTYCTDTFAVPDEWVTDVAALSDIFANGLRKEFGDHLLKTLRRDPTEGDKYAAAYEAEQRELANVAHVKANGHTFVPLDDYAMERALKLAEANEGKLRSCWGILPLQLKLQQNHMPHPQARDADARSHMVRAKIDVDFGWRIDEAYWQHCCERWSDKYPITMAAIAEAVAGTSKAA